MRVTSQGPPYNTRVNRVSALEYYYNQGFAVAKFVFHDMLAEAVEIQNYDFYLI